VAETFKIATEIKKKIHLNQLTKCSWKSIKNIKVGQRTGKKGLK
jgi:hypothetical protein